MKGISIVFGAICVDFDGTIAGYARNIEDYGPILPGAREALNELRVENWLNHFKLPVVRAHASGHASFREIIEMVEKINPKRILPIHTENIEKFIKGLSGRNIITESTIEI